MQTTKLPIPFPKSSDILLKHCACISVYVVTRNRSFKEQSREKLPFLYKSKWETWVKFLRQIQEIKLHACCAREVCLNHKAVGTYSRALILPFDITVPWTVVPFYHHILLGLYQLCILYFHIMNATVNVFVQQQ